jgi:TM2 domain-containing membrane protein YozV
MDYFIAINGAQQGPFPIGELIARGMTSDSLVWRAGMAQWQRADSIPELQALFAKAQSAQTTGVPPPSAGAWPPQSAPPPQQPYPRVDIPQFVPGQSNRVLVGIMAIILGGLGIHKFILGMNRPGIIMLLVSILSCGKAVPVMWAIGLAEGIIYLTKSDEEFYRIYIVGRREWF